MATAQSNADVISSMERQYAEQKAKFEKWKIDNSRQIGTESYNKYVQQFLQWEKEVFEKKAKVVALAQSEAAAAAAIAGPANVDSILGQLLDDVLPMEFLMALVTVHMKDNTFLPCVIENFRKAQIGELNDQSKLLGAAPQYHHTVAAAAQYYPQVASTLHTTMALQAAVPGTTVAWPTTTAPVGTKYRPPSPVRDYKNPVASMPFRDFIFTSLFRKVVRSDNDEDTNGNAESHEVEVTKSKLPVKKDQSSEICASAKSKQRPIKSKSQLKTNTVNFVKEDNDRSLKLDQTMKSLSKAVDGKSSAERSRVTPKAPSDSRKQVGSAEIYARANKTLNVDQTVKSVKKGQEVKRSKEGSVEKSQRVQAKSAEQVGKKLVCASSEKVDEDESQKSTIKSLHGAADGDSSKSFRRLRFLSERAVRRVKTFASRPIKESTMQRFVTKVEARKQAEESGKVAARTLKKGDDVFPRPIQRSKSRDGIKEKCGSSIDPDLGEVHSVTQAPTGSSAGDLPSGCKRVLGNKNNNGKLMIDDDTPFWAVQRKPTEDDLADSNTEDDLQMSADVALDVCDGKVKLVNMPSVPIVLDPMNELAELKRRDSLFYTRDVLFGNSVRSMINLTDSSTKVTPILRRPKGGVTFREPSSRYSYRRENVMNMEQWPFKPGELPSAKMARLKEKRKAMRNKKREEYEKAIKKENSKEGKEAGKKVGSQEKGNTIKKAGPNEEKDVKKINSKEKVNRPVTECQKEQGVEKGDSREKRRTLDRENSNEAKGTVKEMGSTEEISAIKKDGNVEIGLQKAGSQEKGGTFEKGMSSKENVGAKKCLEEKGSTVTKEGSNEVKGVDNKAGSREKGATIKNACSKEGTCKAGSKESGNTPEKNIMSKEKIAEPPGSREIRGDKVGSVEKESTAKKESLGEAKEIGKWSASKEKGNVVEECPIEGRETLKAGSKEKV